MEGMMVIAPIVGVLALVFAFLLAAKVGREDEGTDKMKEIALAIREGAQAFLSAEYKILIVFAAVLFVAIGLVILV